MILRVLLLITFTCCVSGTFVVNVTQSFYQAEENHDITLEWSFTTEEDTSHNDISVYCKRSTDRKILFDLYEGVEYPESQDGQFAGRVQCDKDVLREGQLRLHVSRLKTEDSGNYLCEVSASNDKVTRRWRLVLTERFVLKVTSDGENRDDFFNPAKTPEGTKHTPGGPKKEVTSKVWNKVVAAFGVTLGVLIVIVGLIVLINAAHDVMLIKKRY